MSANHVIEKEAAMLSLEKLHIDNERSLEDMQGGFRLTDGMYFAKKGIEVSVLCQERHRGECTLPRKASR